MSLWERSLSSKYVDAYTPEMQTNTLIASRVTSLAAIEFRQRLKKTASGQEQGLSVDEAYISISCPEKCNTILII